MITEKFLKKAFKYIFAINISVFFIVAIWQQPATGISKSPDQDYALIDPGDVLDTKDTIPYPIKEDDGNPFTEEDSKSPLFLDDPPNLKTDIRFDPTSGQYYFERKLGDRRIGTPYTMDLNEYREYSFDKAVNSYWRQRYQSESFQGKSGLIPQLRVPGDVFDKIFGSNTIDIKPQGSAELIFGVNISNVENPALPSNLQRDITFDYDQKIQMGVNGSVGDKLNLGINYDTEATFDFENKTKVGYQGKEDEIVQSIEAGNVSLPLSGSLITGSHSLFGFKTELQFGKLTVTSIFSQQKGESSSIEIQGGAQVSDFEITADQYEANRHFFLGHYFKDNYNSSLEDLPVIKSGINITKIEVWVTNKSGNYEDARNIIGFMDLGEGYKPPYHNMNTGDNVYADDVVDIIGNVPYPYDSINSLYEDMLNNYPGIRDINQITSTLAPLASQGFVGGKDFEKVENARLLDPSEYKLNKKLGYISLNSALNADEVLAVAYEYTVGGKTYRVGEFSNSGISAPNTLIVKLLKGTNLTPSLPTWELMMKNVYSIGAYQVNSEDFILDVLYKDVKTGTDLNYIPDGDIDGDLLIQVLNLDNLNSNLDPQPDGRFDFVSNVTINPTNGRVFFPVLEPFGNFLRKQIGDDEIADKYVFEELYDSTQNKAQQIPEKNKFILSGSYKSSSGSEIMLNAMNIPEGSVVVTAGGRKLEEGGDYIVDYQIGRVTILNQSLLESGTPIKISLESNSLFNIGTKTLVGSHMDYTFSENFRLGGTILNLNERPLTNKVGFGDEPISNTIWGLDASYNTEVPFLTRAIDKYVPFIKTKEASSITFEGEFAHLIPGHSRFLEDKSGVSFIDDFEGSKTTIDIKTPHSWYLSSVPSGQPNLFPEGELVDDLAIGFNRAKLAWYNVISDFTRNTTATPPHLKNDPDQQSNHFVREVFEQDLFPKRESEHGYPATLSVLNLAYYPTEKGPYNYDTEGEPGVSQGIDESGQLKDPDSRWAGIMRKISSPDFEAANIEYIEFWLMDPFVYNENHKGGDLFFNLGNISEDVLKDSRKSFENGLPKTEEVKLVDSTIWGRVPLQQSVVNAFDNDPQSRQYQDVGLDGLDDDDERSFFSSSNPNQDYKYLDILRQMRDQGEISQEAYEAAESDPSNDNFHYFKGSDYDQKQLSILERYKKYNGLEGNSPADEQNDEKYPTSGSLQPDVEDINQDNTLSENESYYQYRIRIAPEEMKIGSNYITDVIEDTEKRKNDSTTTVKWYQFKIPIYEPDKTVGAIQDYKSIRFVRMFLKNFEDSVILRFAKLNLVRGEWRKYLYDLSEAMEDLNNPQPIEETGYDVSAVNIEENSDREPVNYILPPGVTRVIDPMNPQMRQLNEQAISIKADNLKDGDARAAYKNVSMDMRQYRRLQMFIHAEQVSVEQPLEDNDVTAFIRLGTDYRENYYEYEIPLELTPWGQYGSSDDMDVDDPDRKIVWPESNNLDLAFEVLQEAKQQRNKEMRGAGSTVRLTHVYEMPHGKNTVKVKGNPNLAEVRTIMIGVRNPVQGRNHLPDDGMNKSVEVWMNELRLTDFNENGGWAANARITTKLADFGTVTVAGNTSTPGFGSIEKKVNERSKENVFQYDIQSNFELGKFFPKEMGVRIPMYLGYSESKINPQYNPLDPDILLKESLNDPSLSKAEKDSIINISQDYTRRKSINFTNVKITEPLFSRKKEKEETGNTPAPPMGGPTRTQNRIFSINNFSATYAYNEIFSRNIHTKMDMTKEYYGALNYTYNARPKNVAPFRRSKFLNNDIFKIIKDFNFYYLPSQLSLRTDMTREYNKTHLRNISNPNLRIDPTFDKDFIWRREYSLQYNITKQLKLDFNANNLARIDEPQGAITQSSRDTIWENILDFGRTTNYRHSINATWTVPINKLPLLDWTNLSAKYSATYNWASAPQLQNKDFNPGNTIDNTNSIQLNGRLNLESLYNKVGYLADINRRLGSKRSPSAEMETATYEKKGISLEKGKKARINHNLGTEQEVKIKVYNESEKEVKGSMEVEDENTVSFTTSQDVNNARVVVTGKREKQRSILKLITDHTLHLLMSVKSISVTYSDQNGSVLPGYNPQSKWFGQTTQGSRWAPGWDYVFGFQDENFAYRAANQYQWLSKDSVLNAPYQINNNNMLNIRATLEPVRDMRIDITAQRTMNTNREEYYIYDQQVDMFNKENIRYAGSFSMSYNIIKTAFWKLGESTENFPSKAFQHLKENRAIIADRLANRRTSPDYNPNDPNIDPETGKPVNNYPNGYNELSQQVLLPSFLAAYADISPEKVPLEQMPAIPYPNWRLKYDGLGKIEFLKKYFKTISIGHSYKSSYSLGSFNSNPYYDFDSPTRDGLSYTRDALDYFIPEYEITTVSLTEDFSPLINLDMTWNNSLTTRCEFRKSRNLSLSFSNNQLMENAKKEFILGAGYKIKDLEIIVSGNRFKSDLDLRLDASMRDMYSIIRKLEERELDSELNQITSGQRNISLKFSADYRLNEQFNLRFFYDQVINTPKTSLSFPTSNTKVGISVRFTLIPK